MNESGSPSIFDRSGLAPLSHFEAEEWRRLFTELEREQAEFLRHEAQFRSQDYLWPRDPLHNWSRAWEYPYVYHHLKKLSAQSAGGAPVKLLDLGSGVTFFPFAAAKLGFDVVCCDVDPICERDLGRALAVVPHGPGHVSFRRTDGSRLPFADGEMDAVVCISVLEHIPDFVTTIREAARVLKPGGLFVLTIDLDLRGDLEIGVAGHRKLKAALAEHFVEAMPVITVHPADHLTPLVGPYALPTLQGLDRLAFQLKQNVLKPLFGRKPRPLVPFLLTVEGMVLRKRS